MIHAQPGIISGLCFSCMYIFVNQIQGLDPTEDTLWLSSNSRRGHHENTSKNHETSKFEKTLESISLLNSSAVNNFHAGSELFTETTTNYQTISTDIFLNMNLSLATSYHEMECQNVLTQFAYEKNACGAPDVNAFLEVAKINYTCSDRCGKTLELGPSIGCACDERCIIYMDCCRDMPKICPHTYARGKNLYSQIEGLESLCADSTFAVVYPATHDNEGAQFLTTSTGYPSTMPESNPGEESSAFPSGPRKMKEYFQSLSFFYVVDLTFGIFFLNYAAFLTHRVTGLKPAFIPKVTTLDCLNGSLIARRSSSAAHLLPWCSVEAVTDVHTPFHRVCSPTDIVFCRCAENLIIGDSLVDTCQGHNNVMPLFERFRRSKYPLKPSNHFTTKVCEIRAISPGSYIKPVKKREAMKMRVTPILVLESVDNITGDVKTHNMVHEADELVTRKPIEYILEITNAVEYRLRCPRLTSSISDCQLLDCAPGAVKLNVQGPHSQARGGSCIRPVMAVAARPGVSPALPACSCMRIMSALSSVGRWAVRPQGVCSFDNAFFHQGKKQAQDVEENFYNMTTSQLSVDSSKVTAQPFLDNQLQEALYETENVCLEEKIDQIQICFIGEKREDSPVTESICVMFFGSRLASGSADISPVSVSQRAALVQLIYLSPMHRERLAIRDKLVGPFRTLIEEEHMHIVVHVVETKIVIELLYTLRVSYALHDRDKIINSESETISIRLFQFEGYQDDDFLKIISDLLIPVS
ncbi:hypothetical protein PoB_006253100 [Plakobranchus ocellatus]|uniref:SMB domain-containing protein n=1 Tax=Plakobranchus ocellatus TaxID=259542 RepID=A0AAV4CVU1_9GAST|nr:hypothetical protein PoB_006253100 [Plakobranchus ocellatus]